MFLPLLFSLTAGLRISEAIAVKYSDIDWGSGGLQVHRQLGRNTANEKELTGRIITQELKTKTRSGERNIPLADFVIDELILARQKYEELRKDNPDFQNLDFVCCHENGVPFNRSSFRKSFKRLLKSCDLPDMRWHDLRHPYVKHTTKIFSLRLKVFQAQPVPDVLRKTRGAFQHLREGGTRNLVLQSCNKKRSSWSVPQSKMSLILYAISMRLSGYTRTLSMRRSVSSAVSPSEWKTALAASCRLSCRACSSCFCFTCANTAA